MFRALSLATLIVAGSLAGVAVPAVAQMSVSMDSPVSGDAVLNRDVEVRVAPSENARILSTHTQGEAVEALDTPRGSAWTRVGKGGVPLGFVPKDALDAVPVPPVKAPAQPAEPETPKPTAAPATASSPTDADRRVAIVPQATLAALGDGTLGALVATRNITVREKIPNGKIRSTTIRKGQAVGLVAVRGETLEVALPGGAAAETGKAGWLGVGAIRPDPAPATTDGPLVMGLLGEYANFEEGTASVRAFVAGPGAAWKEKPPMLWPVFRSGRTAWRAAIGPMPPLDLDRACSVLTRRGDDCRVLEAIPY